MITGSTSKSIIKIYGLMKSMLEYFRINNLLLDRLDKLEVRLNQVVDDPSVRREREHLLDEQHRFLLEREEAASLVRLERAARQLGMQPMQPEQMDPLRTARNRSPESPARKSVVINHPAARPPADKGKLSITRNEGRQRLGTPR